jgi:hypothetical protein
MKNLIFKQKTALQAKNLLENDHFLAENAQKIAIFDEKWKIWSILTKNHNGAPKKIVRRVSHAPQ